MNKISKVLAFLVAAGVSAAALPGFQVKTQADPAKPKTQSGRENIHFAKGKSSTVIKRTLAADVGVGNITFTVKAQKGQTIYFSIDGPKGIEATLSVPKAMDPEIQTVTGKTNAYKVVKTGEHYITVVNYTGKVASFTLKVNIPAATKVPAVTRIRVPKGEQVAELKGTLAASGSKKYVAYVIKGNMITIVPQNEATKKVRVRLDGKEFNYQDSTSTAHQSVSKDHTIEIYNPTGHTASYYFWVGFSEHG